MRITIRGVFFTSEKRGRRAAGLAVFGFGVFAAACGTAMAAELGPQSVVREFCRADALGERGSSWGWTDVAPLVTWELEPAWDQITLVSTYTVEPPRPDGEGTLAVDVRYAVVGQVSALGLDTNVYVETVTFRVQAPDGVGWRIIGPMPAPHIFANRVDVGEMRRSLQQGATNFVPDGLFVWHMLRSAGWNVPFEGTGDLLNGAAYRPVERPAVGDLVVYLRDGTPYHVGLWEAENQVVSSTLNAGIMRAALEAFPGEVRYLRLVEPDVAQGEQQLAVPAPRSDGQAAAAQPPRSAPPHHQASPKKRNTAHRRAKHATTAQHRPGRRANRSGSKHRHRVPVRQKSKVDHTQSSRGE